MVYLTMKKFAVDFLSYGTEDMILCSQFELWSLDENGYYDEFLFSTERLSGFSYDNEPLLDELNKIHGLNLVLTLEHCAIS